MFNKPIPEVKMLNKKLQLSSRFRCGQINNTLIFEFVHNLLSCSSPTQVLNKQFSEVSTQKRFTLRCSFLGMTKFIVIITLHLVCWATQVRLRSDTTGLTSPSRTRQAVITVCQIILNFPNFSHQMLYFLKRAEKWCYIIQSTLHFFY